MSKSKFLFQLLFCFSILSYCQDKLISAEYDSVLKYRKLSNSNEFSLERQFEFAKKAVLFSEVLKVDSITIKTNNNLSALCIYTSNFEDFRKVNFENLKLAAKHSDSLNLAIANHNLGWYHHRNRVQNDSAYYYYTKAYQISEQLALTSRQVEILVNISEIQDIEKDYIGSEESAIRAIKLAKTLPRNDYNRESLWLLYNRIGSGAAILKMFDKALEYHQKAFDMAKEMNDGILLQLSSKNNMAFVYKEQGDYEKALATYEEVLKQSGLYELNPNFYALVMDNVAYSRFLTGDKDYQELERLFEKAYRMSDSLNDPINKLNVTIDLSKYYKDRGLTERALQYAQESYKLANEITFNGLLLESLLLLSDLTPGNAGKVFLREHIALSDSLLAHERGIRNKFARIAFETDQIEMENERMATEKVWWTISSVVFLLTTLMVYIIIILRNRNKALKFKQDQQEVNEEIYNLMLSQQDKVDGARADEKKRISQELHDGVLGRLFGTRLSLDNYNRNQGADAAQARSKYISELQNIENDIRKISHDLNTDFVAGSGFMDILTELIEQQSAAYQLKYKFDHTDDINWEAISNKTKINIYRMVQEALQNIYKHAKATSVKISIGLKKSVICLSILDDGIGFDPNRKKKGIGLKNIKSRVKELNGTVEFRPRVPNGTALKVKIPYRS